MRSAGLGADWDGGQRAHAQQQLGVLELNAPIERDERRRPEPGSCRDARPAVSCAYCAARVIASHHKTEVVRAILMEASPCCGVCPHLLPQAAFEELISCAHCAARASRRGAARRRDGSCETRRNGAECLAAGRVVSLVVGFYVTATCFQRQLFETRAEAFQRQLFEKAISPLSDGSAKKKGDPALRLPSLQA